EAYLLALLDDPAALDFALSGTISRDLLLLPRRLLQGVLGRSALVRYWRAAQELLGRTFFSPDPSKRAPLFPLLRPALHPHPRVGCDQIVPVRQRFWHW